MPRDERAELARLRESEARYRHLAENAADLIAEVDDEGTFLFISASCEAILGYRPADLVGRQIGDAAIFDKLHPDDAESLLLAFRNSVSGAPPDRAVYRFRRADGQWRWFESRGNRFRAPDGAYHSVMISRDVTDRERAIEQLRESEMRYRVLSETTHDLVAELDAEGRVLFVSPNSEKVIGYTPAELVGTTPFSLLHPEDVEPLADRFLLRIDAEHRPTHERVFRVRHRDGSWRWLQGGGVNYAASDGEMRIVSACRDVTERVRAAEERVRLERRMQGAQKLESLGLMAGGLAHDFNNLLTPILGDASLGQLDTSEDSPLHRRFERIESAAHHAAALTKQLLDYAGAGSLQLERVNLSRAVLEIGELIQSAISKRVVLRYDLCADVPTIDADPAQISQVILNLITNASEAIEARGGSGRVVLRSGSLEADRALLAVLATDDDLAPGRYAWFEVEDDGCGMDAETRGRIFDPFFTTKFTGRGLGLASVLGIVRKHRGAVEIDSEPGRGTRVRVLCPAHPDADAREAPPRPRRGGVAGGGKLLVADDDAGARELVAETLERAGFGVLCASDGDGAIESFRRHADEIRLVILDRTMPGASGEEALDRIRAVRADVPVVLVSGYSERSTAQRFAGRRVDAMLQKPFLPETLIEIVRDLLAD